MMFYVSYISGINRACVYIYTVLSDKNKIKIAYHLSLALRRINKNNTYISWLLPENKNHKAKCEYIAL